MDKASSATARHYVAPVADSHTQSPAGPEEAAQRAATCLRVAASALVGCNLAAAAWRARHDPQDLAFVVGVCALLAALLTCLRRAERLTPGSPAEERRPVQVQAAVWVLCSVLSCAFAYRAATIMPPALAVVVWCMTAFVVLAGFCLLLLGKHQQYQALDDDAAGDTKAYVKIVGPTDELG